MLDIGSTVHGQYFLDSPSFIDAPKKIDHDKKRYYYVISEQDQEDKDIIWAINTMRDVLTSVRDFPEYEVVIMFHLFNAACELSFTPRYGALVADPGKMEVEQYMFSRNNFQKNEYMYNDPVDFKNQVLKNLGWVNDR